MSLRPVAIVVDPRQAQEAKGVDIRRAIGGDQLVLLDPILLLDYLHIAPSETAEAAGFPWHPHRGIETLTYVVEGRVHHKDSLGNDDGVTQQGSQWMTAGGGIFHEEMLEPGPDGCEAVQVWLNLPASGKMKPPGYAGAVSNEIPQVAMPGGAIAHVVAGSFGDVDGPFTGIAVDPTYLAVDLPAGAEVTLPTATGAAAFAFVYRGQVSFGPDGDMQDGRAPQLVIFGDGDSIRAVAHTDEPARMVVVWAMPLCEPVMQYRSMVMNTVDEMRTALHDLERGTFVQE